MARLTPLSGPTCIVEVEAEPRLNRILRNLSDRFMSPVRQVLHSQLNGLAIPTYVFDTESVHRRSQ